MVGERKKEDYWVVLFYCIPLRYYFNLVILILISMDYVNLYTQTSLWLKKWLCRHRIRTDKDKFIPVRIYSSTTRWNKVWYWVKYLDKEEVMEYIESNKKSWKTKK